MKGCQVKIQSLLAVSFWLWTPALLFTLRHQLLADGFSLGSRRLDLPLVSRHQHRCWYVRPIKNMSRHPVSLFEKPEDRKGGGGNPLDFLFNPYESKIPEEAKKQIYDAEANTAAAKDRGKRIAQYAVLAFLGVLAAFFNGFLTELRSSTLDGADAFDLGTSSFAWVQSNFVFEFLFLNKIGGGLCLLLGGGAGLLAEAEFDTKRINAEKIWEELQRRRGENENMDKQSKQRKKKRRSGKDSKRLGALSEVVVQAEDEIPASPAAGEESIELTVEPTDAAHTKDPVPEEKKKEDGIIGGLKDFYDKADKMAQAQALLLNKKLEDEGLIEKITDESGLKVVGRKAAAKLKKEMKEKDN